MDRLLKQSEVLAAAGFSRMCLYKLRKKTGGFPEPVDVGGGALLRWRESDVQAWIASR